MDITKTTGFELDEKVAVPEQLETLAIGEVELDEEGKFSEPVLTAILDDECPSDISRGESLSEGLLDWFSRISMAPVDIIGQLGGSADAFLIHVESMLIRFALDPIYRTDFLKSPQVLRLIFHVEAFLDSLLQCRGQFRLVFINSYSTVMKAVSPMLWAARQSFLLQCQTTSSPHLFFEVFDDWNSPALAESLECTHPPFILLDDCTDLCLVPEEEDEEKGKVTPETTFPLAFLYGCLSKGLLVALMKDIERTGRKVRCFAISPMSRPLKSNEALIAAYYSSLLKPETHSSDKTSIKLIAAWEQFINICPSPKYVGFRDLLIALSMTEHTLIEGEGTDDDFDNRELIIFFGKMMLLTSQQTRQIPLTSRAVAGYSVDPDWGFYDVMQILCGLFMTTACSWLDVVSSDILPKVQEIAGNYGLGKELVDLLDYRLLETITIMAGLEGRANKVICGEFWNLPAGTLEEMSWLLQTVGQLTEEEASVSSWTLKSSVLSALDLESEFVEKPIVHQSKAELLPFQSPFLRNLLQTAEPNGLLPETVLSTKPNQNVYASSFFDKGPGWKRGFLLDVAGYDIEVYNARDASAVFANEEKLAKFTGDKAKMRQRMIHRALQKGAKRVMNFSSTISVPDAFGTGIRVSKAGFHVWSNKGESVYTADEVPETIPEAAAATPSKKDAKKATKSEAKITTNKVSTKAEAIVKANKEAQIKKTTNVDEERLPHLIANLNTVASKSATPDILLNRILDIIVGHIRFTEELGSLPGVTALLKLRVSQIKALSRVAVLLTNAFTKQFSGFVHDDAANLQALHHLQCFAFQFCQTFYRLYNHELSVEDIQVIQRLLITIGFVSSAQCMFEAWKIAKIAVYKELLASASADEVPATKGKGKPGKPGAAKIVRTTLSKTAQKESLKTFMATLSAGLVKHMTVQKSPYHVASANESTVQLKFMGHLMTRSLGSSPDPRVGFYPDRWQKKLLDIIDDQRSALVCAPTGCGKTFACYYAMEKVLTYDNTSVVVYVCPAKALVHQVHVEIGARFRAKEYPVTCSAILSSLMLQEHIHGQPTLEAQVRHKMVADAACCLQVLVTLPGLLEKLLMSFTYRGWVSRLKYVVLDEIHCIGEGEDEGRAWERIVELMPCPFLALSATVGNPSSFHQWLASAHISSDEKRMDKKPLVEIIHFGERYADLSCYVYSAKDVFTRDSPQSHKEKNTNEGLYMLNPFVSLTYYQLSRQSLSSEFYAPSADMLKAYLVLHKLLDVNYPVSVRSKLDKEVRTEIEVFLTLMHPSSYFQQCYAISKRQYRYFLHYFKDSLCYMVQKGIITRDIWNDVSSVLMTVTSIDSAAEVTGGTLWDPKLDFDISKYTTSKADRHDNNESELGKVLNDERVMNEFTDIPKLYSFCLRMQKLGLLPSLMFNMNRGVVNKIGLDLVSYIKNLQRHKYYGTPEAVTATKILNKKRMEDYRAKVKFRDEMLKLKSLNKEQRAEQGLEREIERALSQPLPPPPVDIAEEYDPEFSFANRHVWGTNHDEITRIFADIARTRNTEHGLLDLIIEGLHRGIGEHVYYHDLLDRVSQKPALPTFLVHLMSAVLFVFIIVSPGFHHSGLSRRIRAAVEMLFRMGFLSVVFATETLSLGVNMPCKSTVFLGDSIVLTPLIYRQTSGRAGRRGYDVMGHVVFWNMAFSKLRRLTCAPLPVLSGEFPVHSTSVLRSYQLMNGLKTKHQEDLAAFHSGARPGERQTKHMLEQQQVAEREATEKSILRLYKSPLFSVATVDASPDVKHIAKLRVAVKYAFRFSVDLLQRSYLLDNKGNCEGLSGIVGCLYDEHPGNISINWLLMSGFLHKFVKSPKIKANLSPQMKTIWDKAFLDITTKWKQEKVEFDEHELSVEATAMRMERNPNFDPLLPPLPKGVLEIIQQQNYAGLQNAIQYAKTLAALYKSNKDCQLPLSLIDFSQSTVEQGNITPESIRGRISKMTIESGVRSPFVAICGRVDEDFTTPEELCSSKPCNIHLEPSQVCQLPLRMVTIRNEKRSLFSNYATIFVRQAKLKITAKESCIDPNMMYYTLDAFKRCLDYLKAFIQRVSGLDDIVSQVVQDSLAIIDGLLSIESA